MKKKALHIIFYAAFVFCFVTLFSVSGTYAADQIRETDVSSPSSGNVIVLLEGNFLYLPKEDILGRINEIRYEACTEGIRDPRDTSRKLTESDYVPIKWSSDLEWIAQTRAAEATVHMDHGRPNGGRWSGVSHNGITPNAEDLAWNYSASILGGIDQWYEEKEDWVNETSGAVTGHYTSIINPRYTYIGIGAFKPTSGYGAVAGELKISGDLDESQAGAQGAYLQKVEVKKSNLTIAAADAISVHIGKTDTIRLNATTSYENDLGSYWSPKVSNVTMMESVGYSSKNENIATVDDSGLVTGAGAGTTVITISYNGSEYDTEVSVEDHKWVVEDSADASCIADGYKKSKCTVCNETKTEILKKTDHSWSDSYTVDKKATCTSEGSESIHCTVCDAIKEGSSRTIDKTTHSYGEWKTTKEATCTESGSREKVCANCGNKIKEVIPSLGQEHKWSEKYTVDKAATYAATGIKSIHCELCGAIKPDSEVSIPKLTVSGTSVSKLKKAKKAITVTWKKGADISGYEIQYGLKSNFKGAKTVRITKSGTTYAKIKKLKAKKKYYVRIRTYKVENGTKYYSAWSAKKSVKTK